MQWARERRNRYRQDQGLAARHWAAWGGHPRVTAVSDGSHNGPPLQIPPWKDSGRKISCAMREKGQGQLIDIVW